SVTALSGTELPKSSQGRIFKIFGPDDTTGTDIELSLDALMLLFLGENSTFSQIVQTLLRMRGFLRNPIHPLWAQCALWVGTTKIKEKILSELGLDQATESTPLEPKPNEFFLWGIQNEMAARKKMILQRAFQEIEFEVRELIRNEMRARKAEEKIAFIQAHEKAFRITLGRDLVRSFGIVAKEADTADVLEGYFNELSSLSH